MWAGASYQPRARYSDGQTGGGAVGFGVGDGERLVGLQVAINSFSTVSSGFGKRMALDLHLHRRIGDLWGVAVGWESVAAPTSVTRDSRENLYAVGSRWLQLRGDPDAPFGLAMLSLGLGTGRFQTESRFVEDAGGRGPLRELRRPSGPPGDPHCRVDRAGRAPRRLRDAASEPAPGHHRRLRRGDRHRR